MKTLAPIIVLVIFCLFACNEVVAANINPNSQVLHQSKIDGVTMKDGQMMLVKNGKTTKMLNAMMMTNGTKVMPDGMCLIKNDTSRLMKEGQKMDLSGKMLLLKKRNQTGKTKV